MRPFVAALAVGCSFAVGFDLPYDVPELTVPGDPAAHASATPYDGSTAPFAIDVDLSQAVRPSQASSVSTVRLASITFTITNASGCFDFVDTVELSIESTKAGSTLPPAVVATGAHPGCVETVALVPTTLNVRPYLVEGASVRVTGSGVPPANAVTFDGHVVLHATL